jgi:hypothetical protein
MIRIDGNSRRQRFALETDLLSGNHTGCSGCGVSLPIVATNLNRFVKYEGKLILVEGVQFLEHPNQGQPCCVGHTKVAKAESSPPKGTYPTDNKIKINGIAPVRIGDVTICNSSIIPGVGSPN